MNARAHLGFWIWDFGFFRRQAAVNAKSSAMLRVLTVAFLAGCHRGPGESDSNKVRVGYIGLTCEAPIFSAVEKGSSRKKASRSRW